VETPEKAVVSDERGENLGIFALFRALASGSARSHSLQTARHTAAQAKNLWKTRRF